MEWTTPFYQFNKEKFVNLLERYQKLGTVYYPVKANDDPIIISIVRDYNCCFEADSIEHIELLIKEFQVNPQRILYSYLVRKKSDIIQAKLMGIEYFVVDSIDEYEKILSISSDANIIIRLNVLQMLKKDILPAHNKWGLDQKKAQEILRGKNKEYSNVKGMSFYIAAEAEYKDCFENVLNTIGTNFRGLNVGILNIGGGISVEHLEEIKDVLEKAQYSIGAKKIFIEPGRYLLNPCIDLIVSVVAIKEVNHNRLIFIDAGIYYGLIDGVVKNKKYDIIDGKSTEKSQLTKTFICGSSSDISDCFGSYNLRKDLEVGDKLIIRECGAYSSVMQTYFYAKPRMDMKFI